MLLGKSHVVLCEILERIVIEVGEPRLILTIQTRGERNFVLIYLPTDPQLFKSFGKSWPRHFGVVNRLVVVHLGRRIGRLLFAYGAAPEIESVWCRGSQGRAKMLIA